MKKQLLLSALAFIISLGTVFAQPGQRVMPTVEERTASTIEKMAPLNLKTDQVDKVKAVLTSFYADQQKAREEMRASGNTDREAAKLKYQEMAAKRDVELKKVLTEEQYTKWLNEIEPTTRPQRKNDGKQ